MGLWQSLKFWFQSELGLDFNLDIYLVYVVNIMDLFFNSYLWFVFSFFFLIEVRKLNFYFFRIFCSLRYLWLVKRYEFLGKVFFLELRDKVLRGERVCYVFFLLFGLWIRCLKGQQQLLCNYEEESYIMRMENGRVGRLEVVGFLRMFLQMKF